MSAASAETAAPPTQSAGRPTVNKADLADKILHCSLPTLDALLREYADFPIVKRGSNGVPWEFDAEDVQEFLRQKRETEKKAAQERTELFSQFSLPIDDVPEAQGLTPAQRASLARARLLEQKIARESGFLISTAELRPKLQIAFERLAKMLDALPMQIGREFNLPDAVQRRIRMSIEDARRNVVSDVSQALRAGELRDAAE